MLRNDRRGRNDRFLYPISSTKRYATWGVEALALGTVVRSSLALSSGELVGPNPGTHYEAVPSFVHAVSLRPYLPSALGAAPCHRVGALVGKGLASGDSSSPFQQEPVARVSPVMAHDSGPMRLAVLNRERWTSDADWIACIACIASGGRDHRSSLRARTMPLFALAGSSTRKAHYFRAAICLSSAQLPAKAHLRSTQFPLHAWLCGLLQLNGAWETLKTLPTRPSDH